jgi:hypothetical protein
VRNGLRLAAGFEAAYVVRVGFDKSLQCWSDSKKGENCAFVVNYTSRHQFVKCLLKTVLH